MMTNSLPQALYCVEKAAGPSREEKKSFPFQKKKSKEKIEQFFFMKPFILPSQKAR